MHPELVGLTFEYAIYNYWATYVPFICWTEILSQNAVI